MYTGDYNGFLSVLKQLEDLSFDLFRKDNTIKNNKVCIMLQFTVYVEYKSHTVLKKRDTCVVNYTLTTCVSIGI